MDFVRRVKMVHVTPSILVQMMKYTPGRAYRATVDSALPDDAVCLSVHYDHNDCTIYVTVASESFEEIEEGYLVPDHFVTIDWVDTKTAT